MCANLAAFFEHVNVFNRQLGRFVRVCMLLDQICKMVCAGQSCRPGTNDQDISFELFPLDCIFGWHNAPC